MPQLLINVALLRKGEIKMERAYLPGNQRDRILDLMKERKLRQRELASRIDCSESTLSRFLSGETERLDSELILRIARVFHVSTDFLLGETDIPDRKQYEITELGLSVEAAKNLYLAKACPEVVSGLLESQRFAELTYLLKRYFEGTLAEGYTAQNQLFVTLAETLAGEKTKPALEAAREINRNRIPVYQADLTQIQNHFLSAVTEVKKEYTVNFSAAKAMTREITENMFAELTKGEALPQVKITPESFADAVTAQVAGMDGVDPAALAQFRNALQTLGEALTQTERQNDDAARTDQ